MATYLHSDLDQLRAALVRQGFAEAIDVHFDFAVPTSLLMSLGFPL